MPFQQHRLPTTAAETPTPESGVVETNAAQERALTDRWVATDGMVALGPVPLASLLREVAQNRLLPNALVRHESWHVWRRLDEVAHSSGEARRRTMQTCTDMSSSLHERARSPNSVPPPPPSSAELTKSATDSVPPPPSARRAVDPIGVLTRARTLEDALLLTLSTAVAAAHAEVGLYHRPHTDLDALVVAGAHGAGAEQLLGERLVATDPTFIAARNGITVVAEPQPGEVGRHVLGRMSRCITAPRGAAMVPLWHSGQLLAVFEIGRVARPFTAREVARVEDIVQALAEQIVVKGWAH